MNDTTKRPETHSHDGPKCPYCGHEQTPDEAYYYDEDGDTIECGECSREYRWTYSRVDSWWGKALEEEA